MPGTKAQVLVQFIGMELLVLSSLTLVGRYFPSKGHRPASRNFKIDQLPQSLLQELVHFALPTCPDKVIYRIHAIEPVVPTHTSQNPRCFLGCPTNHGVQAPSAFEQFIIPAGTYGRQGLLNQAPNNTMALPEGYQKNGYLSFERLQLDETLKHIQDIDFFCALQEK